MATIDVREGTFSGGLPYLAVGSGEPLVYLCGFTLDHRNPKPGLQRTLTLRTLTPLARAGFQVYFTNRWPGMAADTTFADVAERHAEAIRHHFGGPVDVLGASTGGSLALQLIADRPDVVRKAVIASAAYALGPVAKEQQLKLLHAIEETGRYPAHAVLDAMSGKLRSRWLRALLTPVALVAAKRITIENPADTIASAARRGCLRRTGPAPGYPDRDTGDLWRTRPLLAARHVCRDRVSNAAREADHVPQPWTRAHHCSRVLP